VWGWKGGILNKGCNNFNYDCGVTMELIFDWLDKIKPQESFFIQINHHDAPNLLSINYDTLISIIGGNPIIVIDPIGNIVLKNLEDKNIKNIKASPNAIWAEIIENEYIHKSLAYFSDTVKKIISLIKVDSFSRIGIRKQYIHYFEDKQVRRDFFKQIVNFEDFLDVGIVKNMVVNSNFFAKIQILPLTEENKFGIVLDVDIYLEDKMKSKELNTNNVNGNIEKIHSEFSKLLKKVFS